ncbi:Wzz/FepE/Etk N-terminal domain-containing protein [Aeromicrobium wangtongii]|uniref:Wzz/FepE/Etk N-terminal domain-containing protein n=1 Tax=Aeromicrobium wangtongii TaxID=2969247 RepID=A0ABY5M9A1_9ACTN|nr:Wzz/FepE/Etk N-terminal domain-containing protein [Aeromicrobium wangtongii]MCD9196884.1 Wzz/FepE/Etk N-terminal domain-containing protein [Aeromicrobium wangtongii]UUP14392.1 Wzz/FepE/Etk N-terminal domain-containing protein [Aeromicrobium wangtongii]
MRDLWASVARRWILALFCVAATACFALFVASQSPPPYESSADVVLVPPRSTEDPTANRYLSLSGLRQAVDVLTRSLGSDATIAKIRRAAPHGTYEATADFTTSAPILIVTVTAPTSRQTQQLLDAVVAQVPISLHDLQQSLEIAEKSLITPQIVAQDDKPRAVTATRVRAVGASVALALLLSAVTIAAVDNVLLRRGHGGRRSRQAEAAEGIPDLHLTNPSAFEFEWPVRETVRPGPANTRDVPVENSR